MQEQMQRLQQQLEASQKVSTSPSTPVRTAGKSSGSRPAPNQQLTSKPTKQAVTQKTKTQGLYFVVIFCK